MDTHVILAEILEELLQYILESNPTKPADHSTWQRLGKIDKIRRKLQEDSGIEATQLSDPHGRIIYSADETAGE